MPGPGANRYFLVVAMARNRIVLVAASIMSFCVFLADLYLLPDSSVPAVFYAVPIAIVGFLLAPELVIGITCLVLILELADGIIDHIATLRLAADMASLAVIGAVGTALAIRIGQRAEEERRREHYVHTISHDLRAPLTVVIGQAQLLEMSLGQSNPAGRERRSARAIVTAAQRMNIMIQDLVDSARLESGQLSLKTQPTDLAAYMNDVLDHAGPVLDTSRIKVEIPATLPTVLADTDRLERVLMNLLSNALKYSPAGSEVLVRAWDAGPKVEVTIADQGEGIPEEDIPHIFDRFYRASNRSQAEGLGLGLYITKMLVEAHGGRVWVESKVGKGSTFWLSLPTAR